MIKELFFLSVSLFSFCFYAGSQTINDSDSVITVEKARYQTGDLAKTLSGTIFYPESALINNIQGDVVVSCMISMNGKLNNLNIKSSPNIYFSESAISAINMLADSWIPAKVKNSVIDKNYILVFRFRIAYSEPEDYRTKAARLVEKQKFKRALTTYDRGIRENQYDFELFESRSKIKALLEDFEGSKNDLAVSTKIKDEIMSVINVTAFGIVRKAVMVDSKVVKY